MINIASIYRERSAFRFYAYEAAAGVGMGSTLLTLLAFLSAFWLMPFAVVASIAVTLGAARLLRGRIANALPGKTLLVLSAANMLIAITFIAVLM